MSYQVMAEGEIHEKTYTIYNKVRNRFNSSEDYVKFQQFQCQWILDNLENESINLSGKTILDLGSGNGGYTMEFAKRCKIVYGLDLNMSKMPFKKDNIVLLKGDATNLPFKDDSFDFVFCSSLIEHIPDQSKVIHEICRILKNNKFCYLSYPPFYSPVGGHQFKPFHLLGAKTGIILSKMFKGIDAKDFETSFGNWGLYPTTIHNIKNKVKTSNFKIIKISTRFVPINVAKIPILCEFLTWHVEFFLQKKMELNDNFSFNDMSNTESKVNKWGR